MRIFFIFLFILFNISQYQCETPSCKTNCTTIGECWQEAIDYRSSELIEQLFSFSSLSVHVDTYQRSHSSEVNDSILFIDKALEDNLSNELIDSNLTANLFSETKQILIDLCKNLTSTPVEAVDSLPSLACSLSTCTSDKMNFMVMFIISILLTSSILLVCIIQSFQTHRQAKPKKKIQYPVSFVNTFATNNPSINFNSNRF